VFESRCCHLSKEGGGDDEVAWDVLSLVEEEGFEEEEEEEEEEEDAEDKEEEEEVDVAEVCKGRGRYIE
jgi:phage terminase Nu1 subunit (DNA packaging protein)